MKPLLVVLCIAATGVLSSTSPDTTTSTDETQQSTGYNASAPLLNVIAVNSTSVQLDWDNTANEASCPVKRYVIRVKDNSSSRARSWRYDKSTTSVTLNGLRPSTEYNFRLVVDSECTEGKGKAGKWVFIVTPHSSVESGGERVAKSINSHAGRSSSSDRATSSSRQVPGQPQSVRTRVITPDSVLVTWHAPEDGGHISGYMIGYGEGVPDVNWQYLEGYRRNVTIKNLKPSTQYVISVRAFNDVDKGPVVYDLVYTTTTSSNSVSSTDSHPAPIRLQTRMLSQTSVWVQWLDPSLGKTQRLTDSRYYNIHYQATPNGKTLSVIVKELHAVLNDLEPGTRYEFKVRTVKDGHTSPFSETVVNWTSNTSSSAGSRSTSKPGRPIDRDVNWKPMPFEEDDVYGDDDDDDMNNDEWLSMVKSSSRESQQIQSDSSKTKREPGSVSQSRQDVKRSKHNVSARLLPEVTFSTLVLHRISVYITWPATPPGDQCNGIKSQVVGYRLRYQPTDDVGEFISQTLSENYILLENLSSGVKYRYHVKYLLENGGETPWSVEGLFDTTPSHQ